MSTVPDLQDQLQLRVAQNEGAAAGQVTGVSLFGHNYPIAPTPPAPIRHNSLPVAQQALSLLDLPTSMSGFQQMHANASQQQQQQPHHHLSRHPDPVAASFHHSNTHAFFYPQQQHPVTHSGFANATNSHPFAQFNRPSPMQTPADVTKPSAGLQANHLGLFVAPSTHVATNNQSQAFISWGELQSFLADPEHSKFLPPEHPMVKLGALLRADSLGSNAPHRPISPPWSLNGASPVLNGHELVANPSGGADGNSPMESEEGSNSRRPSNLGQSQQGTTMNSSNAANANVLPEVTTLPAEEDLVVWWDEECGRPAPPKSARFGIGVGMEDEDEDGSGAGGAGGTVPDFGEDDDPSGTKRKGEKIVFKSDSYVRVFVDGTEQFPGTGKGPGNNWTRGQTLFLRECLCGFKFMARNSVDPFKRPSILRAHIANCPRRSERDPLKRLCSLYQKAEVGCRKKSRAPRSNKGDNRFQAYPPSNPNRRSKAMKEDEE